MSQATMKKYPAACKERAVKLAVDSDQPIAQTARDLGVNENTLHTWIGTYHRVERQPTVFPLLTLLTSRNISSLQSLSHSIPDRQDNVRRRKDAPHVGPAARGSLERLSCLS